MLLMLDCAALTGQFQLPHGTLSSNQLSPSRNQPALTSCCSEAWISSIRLSRSTCMSRSNACPSMCVGSDRRAFRAACLSRS